MKSIVMVVLLAGLCTGCATTGPMYSTVRNSMPILSQELGRIIFYRPDTLFGAGMRPDILLDGRKVGASRRGTVFYVDVEPGTHHITVPAVMYPGESKIDIALRQNETVYVKTSIGGSSFGGRTNVEVVDSAKASAEIDHLVFVAEPVK
ncbi:DUF2846 domain-containing protein [Geobacter sp.]|uniref:DUF2846 domain-containing protein n=1 Tax=Geobacter sp. TaxID=46610 RepID=UPI001ACDCF15|nr:DUF2846 domain-containing protein [Geobacter sp.]CAG0941796.1 hypothetical protein ANRL1_00697 [Anaerolineae bacterium]